MDFIFFEGAWEWISMHKYFGGFGIFYKNTLGAIFSYIILIFICLMTIIGLFTTFMFLVNRKQKKKKW